MNVQVSLHLRRYPHRRALDATLLLVSQTHRGRRFPSRRDSRGIGGHLHFVWGMVGFVLPALFATVDLRYLRNRLGTETTLFGKIRMNRGRVEDFAQFYVPAWIRMGALFLAMIASVLLLKVIGIEL